MPLRPWKELGAGLGLKQHWKVFTDFRANWDDCRVLAVGHFEEDAGLASHDAEVVNLNHWVRDGRGEAAAAAARGRSLNATVWAVSPTPQDEYPDKYWMNWLVSIRYNDFLLRENADYFCAEWARRRRPVLPIVVDDGRAELPFRLDDWDGAETARTITAFCRESTLMQPECERLHAAVVAQINKERLAMVTVLNVCRDKIKNSKGFACKLARHGPGIAPGEEEEVVVDRNRVLRMTDMDRAKVNWRYELPVPGLE